MEKLRKRKRRIFDIIQIGQIGDVISRTFDIVILLMILLNLFIAIFETFDVSEAYRPVLDVLELVTVIGFTVEYALRLWTAEFLFPPFPGDGRCFAISFPSTELWICCPSCPIICRYSSRRGWWPSGCSGWSASSVCSASTPIMTH